MIPVQISEDAQDDLNEGFLFYEAQEPGLGDYFIACLRADIEGLKVSGGVHRVVYADYYRLLSKVFPYGIFYTMEGGGRCSVGGARPQKRPGVDTRTTTSLTCPRVATVAGI